METTTRLSLNRIHPLMAAAAVSVIIVSLAGAAAITGVLPSSHSASEPLPPASTAPGYVASPAASNNMLGLAPVAGPQTAMGYTPAPAAPMVTGYAPAPAAAPQLVYMQPAPVVVQQRAPAVKHTVHHARAVHHTTHVAYNDAPRYDERPAPQPAPRQPNYLGIGAGALIGGVLGNQVGSGNGKKLATVAGIIGGGMIGNEVSNRNR
jgi:uncharacterized protein YcfJ